MVKTAMEAHDEDDHDDDPEEDDHDDHHEEDERMPNGVGFEMFVHLVMFAPTFNMRDLVHYWVHAAGHHYGHTHIFMTKGYKDADYRYERHFYNVFLSLDQTHDGVLDPVDLILAFHEMESSQLGNIPIDQQSQAEMMLFKGVENVPYQLTFDTWRNMIDKIRDQVAAAEIAKYWRRVFKFYIEEGEMTGYHKRHVDMGVKRLVSNHEMLKNLGEVKEITECAPFKFLGVEEAMVEVIEGLKYKLQIKIETHRGYKCNEEIVEKVCENVVVFKPLPNVCKGIKCLQLKKPEYIKCREVSAISGSLENCIDECLYKSCQIDRDLKNGCEKMHTCAHGSQMRHLGLGKSECMQKCDRNSESGCHPEVVPYPKVVNWIPWKFDLCQDCQRKNWCTELPVKDECELGCQFYTNVPSVTNPESVKEVVDANELFACSLYNSLRKKSENKNMLVSPYSASKVMAMVYMGARGETAEQIKKGMHFPEKNVLGEGFKDLCRILKVNDAFVLETAVMLFLQDGLDLQDQFKKSIRENFYAEVTQLDFAADSAAARTEINNWVKEETMDKIEDLIPQNFLSEVTKMVLVNAMYFKGDWVHQFAEKDTKKRSFYVEEDKSVEVDMMHNDRSKFKMYECEELQAKTIELPYKGDRVSMYIVLPNDKDGLNEVEEGLCRGEKLKEVCSYTDAAIEKRISLYLPKFKVEKTIEMSERLMDLEMRHMFRQGKADFSGINGKNDLYVMDVIQKTFIDVNEYGSEAAAASGVGMGVTSISSGNLPEFKCDRPFLFFLYDKVTDMMLFKGRVVDPTL